jgi:uncharacterized protein
VIINVAQFLKSEVGTVRHVNIDETIPRLTDQIELTAPVHGDVELIRTNRGILARANLTTAAHLECSRCLEIYFEPLRIDFSEEFIPVVDVETGLPANIPHESHTYLINDHHELDLSEAVREYGLLELPMKPLCKSDCAGLCPQCGTNRNVSSCDCVLDSADERFAVLRALLSNDSEKS